MAKNSLNKRVNDKNINTLIVEINQYRENQLEFNKNQTFHNQLIEKKIEDLKNIISNPEDGGFMFKLKEQEIYTKDNHDNIVKNEKKIKDVETNIIRIINGHINSHWKFFTLSLACLSLISTIILNIFKYHKA